ncbi:MAG: hypothetical protein R3293_09185 [Candidatus Promineifilaceae bacterium]|nr:hypothetical protein [Candidatus Promineifilaceae bacterium]
MKSHLLPLSILLIASILLAPFVIASQVEDPSSQTTVLYDARNGDMPDGQGFVFLALGLQANQSIANNVTTLNTISQREEQAGYFIEESILLDRSAGYEVQFTIQIQEESHSSRHRAGFSVIVLSDDLKGIELGFWTDKIWAQEGGVDNLFTRAEETIFDTTSDMISYHLKIFEDTYTLMAGDNEILTGQLRDYTAFDEVIDPYETPNFLFFGDNTSSSGSTVDITYIALKTDATINVTPISSPTSSVPLTPEPALMATATPSATHSSRLVTSPQSPRASNWWRQCTSGYPPKQ